MENYTLHLAMAALVGASMVAVSAYYMHRKTLSQLLEFAKSIEGEREREKEDDGEPLRRYPSHRRRKSIGAYRRASVSLPDVTAISGEVDGEEKRSGGLPVDGIPVGLPRLRTLSEAKSAGIARSASRSSHLRPTSPKSPVASASAFESLEGSDEDTLTDASKLDPTYMHSNGDADPEMKSQQDNNGDQIPIGAATMIRSHSVSGDLHGVQPDPIAADILRKEPEQETFVRLKISPSETPSPDEAESYLVIQECLELRESYVSREAVAPWEKEVISDPSTPKPNPNPFFYVRERKTEDRKSVV